MARDNIVGNKPCKSCQSVGRDSTGNHLLIFKDGGAHCLKCGYTEASDGKVINNGHLEPTQDSSRLQIGTQVSIAPSSGVSVSQGLAPESLSPDEIRGIPKDIVKRYGVKVAYDTMTREITHHFYPLYSKGKLITWKQRTVDTKTFFSLKKTALKMDLFGQALAHGKVPDVLLITEGELDAMASAKMLLRYDVLCVSLPTGANVDALSHQMKWLTKIPKVVLAYDQDEPGYLNAQKTWELLPDVYVMEFSEKDPCDMLKELKTQEFVDAFNKVGKFKPRTLCDNSLLIGTLAEPEPLGLDYPWQGLTDITYGIHLNSIVGIGAAPKAGKSTLMKAIQFQLMFVHGKPIGIIDVEKPGKKTFRELVGYEMGKKIHIPGCVYDATEAERIGESIDPLCNIYDHLYYNGTWEELEYIIRYLYSKGVQYFFIDPVSAIVSHLNASDANQWLSKAMFSMSKLVQALDITVFHVNHLNSPVSGTPHEAGGRIFGGSFTGSRAQYRYSHMLIGMERDQHEVDEDKRNTSTIRIVGDRLTGNTGRTAFLKYDNGTGKLDEVLGSSAF